MSLIIQIGLFIFFLITYVMYLLISYKIQERYKGDLFNGKWFRVYQIKILLSVGAFILFVYLLSGFLSLSLAFLLIIVTQISVILFYIMSGLFGTTSTKCWKRYLWASYEFDQKHRVLIILVTIPIVFAVYSYPFIAGYIYFTHTVPSIELTILIIKLTLIVFIFSFYLLEVTSVIGILISENLDEETRTFSLINQVSGLIPTALYLAIAFWVFGIAGSKTTFSISDFSIKLSTQLLLVLICLFFFTGLVPYIIGTQRAKKNSKEIFKKQIDWHKKLIAILEVPTHWLYKLKLEHLLSDVEIEINILSSSDPSVSLGDQINKNSNLIERILKNPIFRHRVYNQFISRWLENQVKTEVYFSNAYSETRDLDPRFRYLDELKKFYDEVKEIIEDMGQKKNEKEMKKAADVWTKIFNRRNKNLITDFEAAKPIGSSFWIGVGAIAMPVISAILSKFGELAWSIFSESMLNK